MINKTILPEERIILRHDQLEVADLKLSNFCLIFIFIYNALSNKNIANPKADVTAATIQKRITILDSGQPIASK